jgi:hypothetical protein
MIITVSVKVISSPQKGEILWPILNSGFNTIIV